MASLRLQRFINKEYGLESQKFKRLEIVLIDQLNDSFEFPGTELSIPEYRNLFNQLKQESAEKYGI